MELNSYLEVAPLIDYAELEVDTQERDLRLRILEANKYQIPTVLVNPVNVSLAKKISKGLDIKIASFISYPVGAYFPEVKAKDVEETVNDGADEIYMLMAVGAFIDGWVEKQTLPEITSLVEKANGRPTKLVSEISVLSFEQQKKLCDISINSGIDFLVTTTDFDRSNLPEITLDEIERLVNYVKGELKIIHKNRFEDPKMALDLFDIGVNRICTESVRKILKQFPDFPWS